LPHAISGRDGGGLWQISRRTTHIVVLLLAIAIPSLAGLVQPSLHQDNSVVAEAASAAAVAGNLRLDAGVISKRPTVPGESSFHRDAQVYYVQQGDTLSAIAAQFHLSEDTIRWANPGLTDIDQLSLNEALTIPPVDGVWVQVKQGDTLAGLVSQYEGDMQQVIQFNLIRDPNSVQPGTDIMIPNGVGPAYVAPAPADTGSAPSSSSYGGYSRYSSPAGAAAWRFPWGYCTWYVATRRFVPWSGDAWSWFGNAQAMGYATGRRPQPGAIMVTWESPIGHVAYVESVHSDGSWTVSEMNYAGFGIVDYRTIYPGQVPLIGFIY
jgi:surface antigen